MARFHGGPRFILLLTALLALEAVAVWSLHYTVGVFAYVLAGAALALGSAGLAVSLVIVGRLRGGYRAAGVGALLVLGAALWLGHLWVRLHLEAQRAVIFAYTARVEHGVFPEDLGEYRFRDPVLQTRLQAFDRVGDGFRMSFYVASPSVSYWYDSRTGWGYYAD